MRALSTETLIIARTDAIAVEGFDAAIDRAEAYLEAGADVLFIEAPRSGTELKRVAEIVPRPGAAAGQHGRRRRNPDPAMQAICEALGLRHRDLPGGIVRALARAAQDYYAGRCRTNGSNSPFADRMFDFDGLNGVIGTAGNAGTQASVSTEAKRMTIVRVPDRLRLSRSRP